MWECVSFTATQGEVLKGVRFRMLISSVPGILPEQGIEIINGIVSGEWRSSVACESDLGISPYRLGQLLKANGLVRGVFKESWNARIVTRWRGRDLSADTVQTIASEFGVHVASIYRTLRAAGEPVYKYKNPRIMNQIGDYRAQGKSDKEIGALLNISAKYICQLMGVTGHGVGTLAICPECGLEFTRESNTHQICGEECRRSKKLRNSVASSHAYTNCIECGLSFEYSNKNAKARFCSPFCQVCNRRRGNVARDKEICRRHRDGESCNELAYSYDMSASYIKAIKNRGPYRMPPLGWEVDSRVEASLVGKSSYQRQEIMLLCRKYRRDKKPGKTISLRLGDRTYGILAARSEEHGVSPSEYITDLIEADLS